MITDAESEIANASAYMEMLGEASEKITDIRYELEDIAETVRDAMTEVDFDPSELEDIDERLDLLYRLSKNTATPRRKCSNILKRREPSLIT